MASIGGSGSSSNNFSMSNGRFDQNVMKQQIPYLKDLWQNASNQYGRLQSGMEAQLPGAVEGANQSFNTALGLAQNLGAGGAYQGISGADIARQISASNQPLLNAQGPGYQNLLAPVQDRELPGMIGTRQSNLVDQMRLTRDTSNPLLRQASLIQQDTNPNQMSNQQRIYESIMGGSGNSYADALKNQMQADALRTAGTSLNALDARAARAGMSGSSRQGIAQAGALQGINQNLQSNLTNLGYSTFDKDLAQKLDIARQADQANVQRYLGNQQYNLGLVGAGNTAAQNAQQYNLGMGSLGNQQNQQNLNYNLGFGQNVNAFNRNAQDYNLGMNQALMNYNLGQATGAQNYNIGMDQNNIARQNLLTNMVVGQQGSMGMGAQMMPTVQSMAGGGMQQYLTPWQGAQQYADVIGGPIVLGSGRTSSLGSGSSKGGGGGISVGS